MMTRRDKRAARFGLPRWRPRRVTIDAYGGITFDVGSFPIVLRSGSHIDGPAGILQLARSLRMPTESL